MAVEDKDVWTERVRKYGLLDELMAEIPGKDNYGAHLEDDSLGDLAKVGPRSQTDL